MPTYRAKYQGYHDDVLRKPGSLFESPIIYPRKDTIRGKNVDIPLPTWMELVSEGEAAEAAVKPTMNRVAVIKKAINAMVADDPDQENVDYWIGSGAPNVTELINRTGYQDLSAEERNDIWESMKRPISGTTPIV